MLERYLAVIDDFVNGSLTAESFESDYIDLWYQTEWEPISAAAQMIVGDLFLWVDCLSNSPEICPPAFCLDANGLKEKAKIAHEQLTAYLSQ